MFLPQIHITYPFIYISLISFTVTAEGAEIIKNYFKRSVL
jgi:hypothetical protein